VEFMVKKKRIKRDKDKRIKEYDPRIS